MKPLSAIITSPYLPPPTLGCKRYCPYAIATHGSIKLCCCVVVFNQITTILTSVQSNSSIICIPTSTFISVSSLSCSVLTSALSLAWLLPPRVLLFPLTYSSCL